MVVLYFLEVFLFLADAVFLAGAVFFLGTGFFLPPLDLTPNKLLPFGICSGLTPYTLPLPGEKNAGTVFNPLKYFCKLKRFVPGVDTCDGLGELILLSDQRR
jgi:hypothetical protein